MVLIIKTQILDICFFRGKDEHVHDVSLIKFYEDLEF